MAKEKSDKTIVNPLLFRYPPNNRFIKGSINQQVLVVLHKEDYGTSITDKESYRLSLAGRRGAVSNVGSANKGWYMFDDGKYDINKDFSYIMRKDLSIVDIDNYTEIMKRQLEESDESLKSEIESQIKKLEAKREELVNKNNTNSSNSVESSPSE